jgi:hypothetical protein
VFWVFVEGIFDTVFIFFVFHDMDRNKHVFI